jgi:hypothetical protein
MRSCPSDWRPDSPVVRFAEALDSLDWQRSRPVRLYDTPDAGVTICTVRVHLESCIISLLTEICGDGPTG